MNELDFIEFLAQQQITDDSNFDNYASQFVNSLVDLGDPGSDYWHGRLIGYDSPESGSITNKDADKPSPSPYEINFLGKTYCEKDFRNMLMNKNLHIKSFKLVSSPSYEIDKASPKRGLDPQIVSYEAEIMIDGETAPRHVSVTHHIRRTYLSYHTEVKEF